MDELSWRARLAKKNINILNMDDQVWYYEFMYHPRPGQTKWCKTFCEVPFMPQGFAQADLDKNAKRIEADVLKLRKELEG